MTDPRETATDPENFDLTGASVIAGTLVPGTGPAFTGEDPRGQGTDLPGYRSTSTEQLDDAVTAAERARQAPITFDTMASALDAIADAFETHQELVVDTADHETALGRTRLEGELARTVGQFQMMAAEARAGTRRDRTADAAGQGPAEPGLFRTTIPIGVVAVYAASNFPLAFGVAGTDTSAALAAGCPVVAKAHPAQPATAELCGRLVSAGLAAAGASPGFFSVLHEEGHELGQALATHPGVDAIAFTGSHRGGRALFDLASRRPRPIPVFAEMGSLNPLFVSPGAAAARPDALVEGILGSYLMGEGQFCTKPGLVVLPKGADGRRIAEGLAAGVVGRSPNHPMLTVAMTQAFTLGTDGAAAIDGVRTTRGDTAVLVTASPRAVIEHPELRQEIFGPVTIVVQAGPAEIEDVLAVLDPSLTGTIHAEDDEGEWVTQMADLLARKVGRVVLNGYPTGVRVSAGQHHGGPYPATTSPHHTSVGLAAIDRFLRPVTFQSFESDLLPGWADPEG